MGKLSYFAKRVKRMDFDAMMKTAKMLHKKTGKPTAWRVENSWGKDACKDGYFIITDRWFDAYVGQAIVHRDYVPADIVAAWDDPTTPVVHMDPWSPMFGLSD